MSAPKPAAKTATLTWRDVYPGEWKYDGFSYVWSGDLRDGSTTPCQVRGYRYLTGFGHGALGLPEADATRIQAEVGRLIAAAPDLLEALADLFASYKELADSGDAGFWALEDTDEGKRAMAVIAKATGADQ